MTQVVVGLSGGVDSSTTATILHHQGHQVVGVTLWLMKGKGQCCSEGMVDAAKICEQLGVAHHIVDTRELFQANIVDYLVSGYEAGVTPLPCSQCNRMVKFGPMLHYAQTELGIETIATGHYARIRHNPETGRHELLRARDRNKDQSYFLYDLQAELLAHIRFPLGETTKAETRRIAAQYNLVTADKPESQDLCLIEAHGSMRTFLDQYIAPRQGEIVDTTGQVLGEHQGIHHYTIGQRKGLGVSAPEPLYVMKLDPVMNQVVVGRRHEASQTTCTVQRLNWLSITPPTTLLHCQVQIRYRSPATPVTAIPLTDGRFKLQFDGPQFGITPGQAAVFYQGEVVLGGGIIEREETQG
ncbi:MAG: tRNA 2-thiouridine(34) synthase MnmA [Cyanobacteria bacterium P01_G01_bin.54]